VNQLAARAIFADANPNCAKQIRFMKTSPVHFLRSAFCVEN